MPKKGILDKIVYTKLCFTTGNGNIGMIVEIFMKIAWVMTIVKVLFGFTNIPLFIIAGVLYVSGVAWTGHLYLKKGFFEREQGIVTARNPQIRELLENTKHET